MVDNSQAAFCPRDGAPRAGSFRFCRVCGYDFDAEASAPQPTRPAGVAPPQAPLGTYPVDRHAQMQVYRSSVGWSCLGRIMVVAGAILGFVVIGSLAASVLKDNILLELLIGFLVGPLVGAAVGWWLWTEIWGRR